MFEFHVNGSSPLYRKTLQWAFLGLALHLVAETLAVVQNDLHWALPLAFGLAGTALMVVGLRYMALSKRRSPGWDCWDVWGSRVGSAWPCSRIARHRERPRRAATGLLHD